MSETVPNPELDPIARIGDLYAQAKARLAVRDESGCHDLLEEIKIIAEGANLDIVEAINQAKGSNKEEK